MKTKLFFVTASCHIWHADTWTDLIVPISHAGSQSVICTDKLLRSQSEIGSAQVCNTWRQESATKLTKKMRGGGHRRQTESQHANQPVVCEASQSSRLWLSKEGWIKGKWTLLENLYFHFASQTTWVCGFNDLDNDPTEVTYLGLTTSQLELKKPLEWDVKHFSNPVAFDSTFLGQTAIS